MAPPAGLPDTASLLPVLREIRHDLHAHPELGFEETRTQAKVRAWLTERGYSPTTCAKTGLVADLHPERYGQAPTIALRGVVAAPVRPARSSQYCA